MADHECRYEYVYEYVHRQKTTTRQTGGVNLRTEGSTEEPTKELGQKAEQK